VERDRRSALAWARLLLTGARSEQARIYAKVLLTVHVIKSADHKGVTARCGALTDYANATAFPMHANCPPCLDACDRKVW
jgi:hypothetical protein